jgi:heme-degrading monooxygenase HmoA
MSHVVCKDGTTSRRRFSACAKATTWRLFSTVRTGSRRFPALDVLLRKEGTSPCGTIVARKRPGGGDSVIRILIERRVHEGSGPAYERTQRELRLGALREHGYLMGETLRDLDDPNHYVVVSTWRRRQDWDEWATSDARHGVLERLAPLVESERITLFEHV